MATFERRANPAVIPMHARRIVCKACVVVALAVAVACSRKTPQQVATHPQLQGEWNLELRFTDSSRLVHGTVIFVADSNFVDRCPNDLPTCVGIYAGTHNLTSADLGYDIPHEAHGALLSNGEFRFVLGSCCDRGELDAKGRFEGQIIRGRFAQTVLGNGRRGEFILIRAAR